MAQTEPVAALSALFGFTASRGAQAALGGEKPTEAHTARLAGNVVQRGPKFHLTFPYDPDAVMAVKAINGRRWDAEGKVWTIPVSSIRQVREFCARFGLDTSAIDTVPDSDPVIEPEINIDADGFIIRFPYDRDLHERVRDLPTATYDRLMGTWRVSRAASMDLAVFAKDTNAVIDSAVEPILETARHQLERLERSRATDADLTIENLNGELLPFQRAGVAYTLEALGYTLTEKGWAKDR